MDLNKVMIIGRLTQDPESRTTPQGTPVTNFSLATSRVWKDQQGNQQEKTEFHNVVAWRRLGEICAQYLNKGKQIYLEGHLETRNWEGQDGQKRYRTEIIADNMIMLGSRGDSGGGNQQRPAAQQQQAAQPSPAAQVDRSPEQQEQVAAVSDEEIRIEDIPF